MMPGNYNHKRKTKNKKSNASSFTIEKEDTLLDSLITNLPQKSRKILKIVLGNNQVSVDGKPVRQFNHVVSPGQQVDVNWATAVKQQHPKELNIVYMDDAIIVINKPSGLLTIATDKEKRKTAYSMLSNYVKSENKDNKIFIIHRIDRETSGLLMFTRSEEIKHQIQETWSTTISQRAYVGVVEGVVDPVEGTISSYLKESKAFIVYSSQNGKIGKRAVTRYKTLQANNNFTLLQLNLETGRKHQIRVHMQDIGHPVVGDKKYGSGLNLLGRMGLHAQVLAFRHPITGEQYQFDTGIPTTFLRLVKAR